MVNAKPGSGQKPAGQKPAWGGQKPTRKRLNTRHGKSEGFQVMMRDNLISVLKNHERLYDLSFDMLFHTLISLKSTTN